MSDPPAAVRRGPVAVDGSSRERILAAALRGVARYGFNGMSLQLLADQVGLHKSTLFHHFSGKGELAAEAMKRVMADVLERVEPLDRADPPDLDQLVAVVEELDAFFAETPGTALFVMRVLLGPGDEFYQLDFARTEDPAVRLFSVLGRWLDRARRAGVVRPLGVRQAIVNMMALVLFYPALIDVVGGDGDLPFGDPRSPGARENRRRELAGTLRRSLMP